VKAFRVLEFGFIVWVLAALLGGVVLAGCSGGPDETGTPTKGTPSASNPEYLNRTTGGKQ